MLSIEWVCSFLALGAIVGVFAGLLGIGGGGIMVPVLTFIFLQQGIAGDNVMHLALGTSMASIIMTSASSLLAHRRNGAVLWPVVKTMSVGVLLGSFCATFVAAFLNAQILAMFFVVFMIFVAARMWRKSMPDSHSDQVTPGHMLLSATGIGAVSALVSIGGGSLTVPYLVAKNVDIKKAIGTSAAIGLPISLAGTAGYMVNGWQHTSEAPYTLGFIYLPAVILISLTSMLTAPYGAKLAQYLPVAILKKVFALLLILLSVKMLLSLL